MSPKLIFRSLLTTVISLLLSVELSAYAGWTDRAIQARTDKIACSVTVIAVQVILSILFLVVLRNNRVNRLMRRTSEKIVSWKYFATILFWVLLAFCLAPYLALSSAFYWTSVTLVLWLMTNTMCFSQRVRKICTSPSWHYYLMNFSIQQIIGYAIYSRIHSTKFFEQLFCHADDYYPGLIFYPESIGISRCTDKFIGFLLLETLPIIVCLVNLRKPRLEK